MPGDTYRVVERNVFNAKITEYNQKDKKYVVREQKDPESPVFYMYFLYKQIDNTDKYAVHLGFFDDDTNSPVVPVFEDSSSGNENLSEIKMFALRVTAIDTDIVFDFFKRDFSAVHLLFAAPFPTGRGVNSYISRDELRRIQATKHSVFALHYGNIPEFIQKWPLENCELFGINLLRRTGDMQHPVDVSAQSKKMLEKLIDCYGEKMHLLLEFNSRFVHREPARMLQMLMPPQDIAEVFRSKLYQPKKLIFLNAFSHMQGPHVLNRRLALASLLPSVEYSNVFHEKLAATAFLYNLDHESIRGLLNSQGSKMTAALSLDDADYTVIMVTVFVVIREVLTRADPRGARVNALLLSHPKTNVRYLMPIVAPIPTTEKKFAQQYPHCTHVSPFGMQWVQEEIESTLIAHAEKKDESNPVPITGLVHRRAHRAPQTTTPIFEAVRTSAQMNLYNSLDAWGGRDGDHALFNRVAGLLYGGNRDFGETILSFAERELQRYPDIIQRFVEENQATINELFAGEEAQFLDPNSVRRRDLMIFLTMMRNTPTMWTETPIIIFEWNDLRHHPARTMIMDMFRSVTLNTGIDRNLRRRAVINVQRCLYVMKVCARFGNRFPALRQSAEAIPRLGVDDFLNVNMENGNELKSYIKRIVDEVIAFAARAGVRLRCTDRNFGVLVLDESAAVAAAAP